MPIYLRLGDTEAARTWLREKAPKNDARLWAMWRYQYLTQAAGLLAETNMTTRCWDGGKTYLEEVISAARAQVVNYPRLL